MLKIKVLRVMQTGSGKLSFDSYKTSVRCSFEHAKGFLVDGVPYVYNETPQGDELQALNYAVELVQAADTQASDALLLADLGVSDDSSK